MTENTTICIIVLIVGIVVIIISIYQFILSIKDNEEERMIIAIPFFALGCLFISLSILHWNDDDFKTIDCTSYEVEEIITIKNDSIVENKYKIYYK